MFGMRGLMPRESATSLSWMPTRSGTSEWWRVFSSRGKLRELVHEKAVPAKAADRTATSGEELQRKINSL